MKIVLKAFSLLILFIYFSAVYADNIEVPNLDLAKPGHVQDEVFKRVLHDDSSFLEDYLLEQERRGVAVNTNVTIAKTIPLYWAVIQGGSKKEEESFDAALKVDHLLECGADPTYAFPGRKNGEETTLLHIATLFAARAARIASENNQMLNNCSIMRSLMCCPHAQVKVNARLPESRATAMHIAAQHGCVAALYELTGFAADIDSYDASCQRPLHYAIRAAAQGRGYDAVRYLLVCGSNPNSKKDLEVSPLGLLFTLFKKLVEDDTVFLRHKEKLLTDLCAAAGWLVYYGADAWSVVQMIDSYKHRHSNQLDPLRDCLIHVSSRCGRIAWRGKRLGLSLFNFFERLIRPTGILTN